MSNALQRAQNKYLNKLRIYDASMKSEGYVRTTIYLTPGMVMALRLYEASFTKRWKKGETDTTYVSQWIDRAVKRFFEGERERLEKSTDPANRMILAIMDDPKAFKEHSGYEAALLKTLLVLAESEQESSEKGEQHDSNKEI